MFEQVLEIIGWICMGLGAFFVVSGALGMLRFPDFYSRLHPAGVVDSFGSLLILVGIAALHGFTLFSAKLILLALFLMITSATATHVLAKVAFLRGMELPKHEPKHEVKE